METENKHLARIPLNRDEFQNLTVWQISFQEAVCANRNRFLQLQSANPPNARDKGGPSCGSEGILIPTSAEPPSFNPSVNTI